MSGAEAGFVIGLISSVILIIEAAKTVYNAAADAKGQPEAFRQVAARLPLVVDILRSAEKNASELDETTQEAIEPTLKSCKAKAEKLQEIFQKVVRKDDDKWFDRYKKAIRTLEKGDKVECLMEGILNDTQLLACEKLMGIATESQVKEFEEGIKEMKEMPSSLQEETGSVTQNHQGSGNNNANTGRGAMHTGTGDLYHNDIKGDAHFGSNPGKQVINYYNSPHDSQNRSCLKDLRTTDPREDKKRIEQTKGGLLKDSYRWILDHSDFRRWRNDTQRPLLWIKGDPGKGKTMLLCGIIDEMIEDKDVPVLLSYFFCQAIDSRLNNATAVLRGLIYLLVQEQPSLISHVQKKYEQGAETPFEGDSSLKSTYLIINALDECIVGLLELLAFLVQHLSVSSHIKLIISSRNWPGIKEQLNAATQKFILCLELNEDSISEAVDKYIRYKVDQLALHKNYDNRIRDTVQQHLSLNSDNTFLWVALACQNLKQVKRWNVLDKLKEFPPGLEALYQQMIDQIDNSEDAETYRQIIAVISTVLRPITLAELTSFVPKLEDLSDDYEALIEIVGNCGSFLTLRERTISFIHQSAKDFLVEKAFGKFFPTGSEACHYMIFSRSLQVLSKTLRRDVYSLRAPGITIDQVKQPDPDPLAAVEYSCLYWVDHLLDFQGGEDRIEYLKYLKDLKDSGSVYDFLRQYFLYWLEALSLLKSVPKSIVMIKKLEDLQLDKSPNLYAFIHDARRFAVYNRSAIEQAPLQAYCSALVFAPEKSIIREIFEKCIPPLIQGKPRVETHWNAMLQTLEGHTNQVSSVAFSPNGKQIVSGSYDKTVRRWDAATGQQLLPVLKGHIRPVSSVAFSPDGQQIVSGSDDRTVRRWDAATGQLLLPVLALEGHTNKVTSVAFSLDGKQIVSGSDDKTVRRWDAATGQLLLPVLKGHVGAVSSVAFSPDGKQIVSVSTVDRTLRLWDAVKGATLKSEGLSEPIASAISVTFSPNCKHVAFVSNDMTLRLWDTMTRAALQLEVPLDSIKSIAFSADSKLIMTISRDSKTQFWTSATGAAIQMREGLRKWFPVRAFPLDGNSKHALSVTDDWILQREEKVLWLPYNYRPTCKAVWGMVVALGHASGRVSILQIQQGLKLVI